MTVTEFDLNDPEVIADVTIGDVTIPPVRECYR